MNHASRPQLPSINYSRARRSTQVRLNRRPADKVPPRERGGEGNRGFPDFSAPPIDATRRATRTDPRRSASRLSTRARARARTRTQALSPTTWLKRPQLAPADSAKNRPLTWTLSPFLSRRSLPPPPSPARSSPALFRSPSLPLAGRAQRRQARRRGRSPCGRSAGEEKGELECKRDTGRSTGRSFGRPVAAPSFRPCAPSRTENNRFIVSPSRA